MQARIPPGHLAATAVHVHVASALTVSKWQHNSPCSRSLFLQKSSPSPRSSCVLSCLHEEARRKMILGSGIFHVLLAIVNTKKCCLPNPLCHAARYTCTCMKVLCSSGPAVNFHPHGYTCEIPWEKGTSDNNYFSNVLRLFLCGCHKY